MTIFAGIVRLDGRLLPEDWVSILTNALSRSSEDIPQIFQGESFVLAKVDIGAFGVGGSIRSPDGSVSLLAGQPILDLQDSSFKNRLSELEKLHEDWRADLVESLRMCEGTYCASFFDLAQHRLWLIADKLAVRPIYYSVENGIVYFATALRILESLPFLQKKMDVRGVTEIAAFGFPLADRTPYANIKVIGAGEVVEASVKGVRRIQYWRWDKLQPNRLTEDETLIALHTRFENAIRKRLGEQRCVLAFLSGGLDSRCIVATLRNIGAEVHTLNHAPIGTMDLEFGRLMAARLGTRHFENPLPAVYPTVYYDKHKITHEKWYAHLHESESRPEHPQIIWSGDGGSVGVGHVYLKPPMIEAARLDGIDRAAEVLVKLNGYVLPKRLFKRKIASLIANVPLLSIQEELSMLESFDVGRNLHLFFMLNDQRRHLMEFFETIDLRRLELNLPFFDGKFLELILSSPVDPFLLHRFYNRWLSCFPEAVREVPWQSYPRHEPCPLPVPDNLRYQWQSYYDADNERRIHESVVQEADMLLQMTYFPKHLLRKWWLRIARWAVRFGQGDLGYLIKTSKPFVDYWQQTQGQFEFSSMPSSQKANS